TIVAPRGTVEKFWNRVRKWHTPARLVRVSQPVLAVDRLSLRQHANGVPVRRAVAAEWRIVANNSARMIEHELAYRPRDSMEFDTNVRQTVERGLWWVGEANGELCFFCNAGPRSSATLQLQGIWTPPEHRGKGYGSAALAAISEELLNDNPTLSLYVNDFNEPALALYRRIGFSRVSEFSTILF
ncbi:MAG: GNAT family N-acetyltransferase, partial [Candidatus Eremiobacteraeota bacterium]|nr:GNAT family N-acetyltransferase [Candidatus Eremiobacteraeota bacterium]